jgi:hypothetical protein
MQNISHLPGFDPRTVQLVARRYTEYAIYKVTLLAEHHVMFDKGCISAAVNGMKLKLYDACVMCTYRVGSGTAVMHVVRPTHVDVVKYLIHMVIWPQQQNKLSRMC